MAAGSQSGHQIEELGEDTRPLVAWHVDGCGNDRNPKGRDPHRGARSRGPFGPRDRAWPDRREGAAQILRIWLFQNVYAWLTAADVRVRPYLPCGARYGNGAQLRQRWCFATPSGARERNGLTFLATLVGVRLGRIVLYLGLRTKIAAVSKINWHAFVGHVGEVKRIPVGKSDTTVRTLATDGGGLRRPMDGTSNARSFGYHAGASTIGRLEPAPVAVVAAATENQQYEDYDQKCGRAHDTLLRDSRPLVRALHTCRRDEVECTASESTQAKPPLSVIRAPE